MRTLLITIALLFAMPALAAESEAGGTFVVEPSAAPTELPNVLTAARLEKLTSYSQSHGHDHPINSALADMLKIKTDRGWAELHQISVRSEGGHLIFARLPDQDGYVFGAMSDTLAYYFHVDMNLDLIAATTDRPHAAPAAMPSDVQQTFLPRTMDQWAKIADKLMTVGKQ